MNHKRFTALLRTKYPDCELHSASAHGAYASTEKSGKVSIVFSPGGKVYQYTGSYTDILERLGIMREYEVLANGEGRSAFYTEQEAIERVNQENARQEKFTALSISRGWYVYPPKNYTYRHIEP